MTSITCFNSMCDKEAEISCNCTSPEIYSCNYHAMNHLKSDGKSHCFDSLFLKPNPDTKKAILSYFVEQKSKIKAIKAEILVTFSKTINKLENTIEELLKEIDINSTNFNRYFQKILNAEKLSRLEKDPLLILLSFQECEAIEKAKTIFVENKSVELVYEIERKIDKTISKFFEGRIKVVNQDRIFKVENDKHMNFEKEENNIQLAINKYKEAIKINPNNDDAFNRIGILFENEKRYEDAIKYYNDAIKINPNKSIYYERKANALYSLDKREQAIECYKEAIRINPNEDNAYSCIGNFYIMKRDMKKQ